MEVRVLSTPACFAIYTASEDASFLVDLGDLDDPQDAVDSWLRRQVVAHPKVAKDSCSLDLLSAAAPAEVHHQLSTSVLVLASSSSDFDQA